MGKRARISLAVVVLAVLLCSTAGADITPKPKGWDRHTKHGRTNGGLSAHWWLLEEQGELDNDTDAGQYSSIVLDSGGFPHIAHYDSSQGSGSLQYTYTQSDREWFDDTGVSGTGRQGAIVDTGGGQWADLALDSNDNPHFSYTKGTPGNLWYAHDSDGDGTFTTMNVTSFGAEDTAQWTSLALDSSNNPHISYYDSAGSAVRYASFDGSSWSDTLVEDVPFQSGAGNSTSLALASDGTPYVAYYDSGDSDVNLAFDDGSGFSGNISAPQSAMEIGTFDTYGTFASLALDERDRAHLSYHNSDADNVAYASFTQGGGWSNIARVDDTGILGQWTSIDTWNSELVGITYTDNDSGNLYFGYAGIGKSNWTTQAVDKSGEFNHTSLAFGGPNSIHISYNDTNGGLKYAISSPEPGSSLLALLSVGIGAFLVVRRKKNNSGVADDA
jgi:hypothetical protein